MNKSNALPTEFAPAERASPLALKNQISIISEKFCEPRLLDAVPTILTILNGQRQIVYANKSMLAFLGISDAAALIGLRSGDALGCAHAAQSEQGCGTTIFCSTCGAARATLSALNGQFDVQECRILKTDGDALDLRVWATPLEVNGEKYTIFALLDIADEKRRRALERIFFHDIMNVASGLRGFVELSAAGRPEDAANFQAMIRELAEKMIEDIQAQRDLANAEHNDLVLKPVPLQSRALALEVAAMYKNLPAVRGVSIIVSDTAEDAPFTCDKVLIRRVLGNMVKNAVEASQTGQNVTIDCRQDNGHIEFSVHNPAVIPRDVQLQLFQRSFSTKGAGRGLGTYSIKLLGERYLKGAVSFDSAEGRGTTFRVKIPASPD